jgi:hypothetical protein
MCDYDLRGLPEPRCPECGFRFTWEELRDPRRGVHRYLFEHHPQRNIKSFWRTFVGGLRPGKFWRELHPAQPWSRRRLVLYWLIYTALCLAPLAVHAQQVWQRAEDYRITQRQMFAAKIPAPAIPGVIAGYKSIDGYLDTFWPELRRRPAWEVLLRTRSLAPVTLIAACLALWPVLTLAGLLIFQASMRKARVRQTHVLRCAVYCGDVVLPFGLLIAVAVAINFFVTDYYDVGTARGYSVLILFALPLLMTWRLRQAYRHYMRFDHALATAFVTQLMILLLAFKLALDWNVIR